MNEKTELERTQARLERLEARLEMAKGMLRCVINTSYCYELPGFLEEDIEATLKALERPLIATDEGRRVDQGR